MPESMLFQILFGVPVFAEAAHLFAYHVPIVPYGRDFGLQTISGGDLMTASITWTLARGTVGH